MGVIIGPSNTTCQEKEPPVPQPLAEAAREFARNLIPVRPLRPGRKPPLPDASGAAMTLADPDQALEFFQQHPEANLGACLAPIGGSPIIVVDIDLCDLPVEKHESVWQLLRDLGLSSKDPVWIQRTGRGNTQVFYFVGPLYSQGGDAAIPLRHTNAQGLHIDLLSNGYVVVPPSNTKDEPPKTPGGIGGGPYLWVKEHSPEALALIDLAPIPVPLLDWWRQLAGPQRPAKTDVPSAPGGLDSVADLLKTKITSYRNVTLTKIAGLLAQKHPASVVHDLLNSINQSHCVPPLQSHEVEAIASSIGGREMRKPQVSINHEGFNERLLFT